MVSEKRGWDVSNIPFCDTSTFNNNVTDCYRHITYIPCVKIVWNSLQQTDRNGK